MVFWNNVSPFCSIKNEMTWYGLVLYSWVWCVSTCYHHIVLLCYCVMLCYCAVQLGVVCVSTCYHHIYDRGDKKMTEAGASSQHGPSALALTHTNVPNVIYKHQGTHWKIPKPQSMHVTHLWVSMKVAYSGLSNTHRSWSLLFSLPCGDFYSVAC